MVYIIKSIPKIISVKNGAENLVKYSILEMLLFERLRFFRYGNYMYLKLLKILLNFNVFSNVSALLKFI